MEVQQQLRAPDSDSGPSWMFPALLTCHGQGLVLTPRSSAAPAASHLQPPAPRADGGRCAGREAGLQAAAGTDMLGREEQ